MATTCAADVLELRRRAVLVPQLPAPLAGPSPTTSGRASAGARREVEELLAQAGLDGPTPAG